MLIIFKAMMVVLDLHAARIRRLPRRKSYKTLAIGMIAIVVALYSLIEVVDTNSC